MEKLKNYEEYRNKILFYAKAMGIKMEFKDVDCGGQYMPSRRRIQIDKDLTQVEEIGVMLHELGHALDDHLIAIPGFTSIDRAYRAVYNKKYSPNQLRIVVECEKRAWKYGKVIAKMLNIRLGKWYDKCTRAAVADYRRE